MFIPLFYPYPLFSPLPVKKGYLSYIKNLLRLSDEAPELADRHNIGEYKLRYV
jgi:hypothetical protein